MADFDRSHDVTISLVPGVQLRMRSLKFRLHSQWSRARRDDSVRVRWTPDNLLGLHWWTMESNLLDKDLWDVSPDFLLYTEVYTRGWGCSLLHHTAGGLWSNEEPTLRINLLELRAVRLTLVHF